MIKIDNGYIALYPIRVTLNSGEVFEFKDMKSMHSSLVDVPEDAKISELDSSQYCWLEGLPYPGSPEALEHMIAEGEEVYKQKQQLAAQQSNEQLRADIDYIMLMGDL